jgi:hypothetical protein
LEVFFGAAYFGPLRVYDFTGVERRESRRGNFPLERTTPIIMMMMMMMMMMISSRLTQSTPSWNALLPEGGNERSSVPAPVQPLPRDYRMDPVLSPIL